MRTFLLDMAFWQSWLEELEEDEMMTVDELRLLSERMAPLIDDALAFYLTHLEAPLLKEGGPEEAV